MTIIIKLTGVGKVVRELRKGGKKKREALARGMMRAGLFLQRESQKIVPVDTGALRNSAFTRKTGTPRRPQVSVGYTVDYAIFVHENLSARHKAGKQAKFLEAPARLNRSKLIKIIEEEVAKA